MHLSRPAQVAIRSHTDNPYRDPFPGAQILVCRARADAGGRTTVVDGFAAAARLRRDDPGAFALLAATPHPYEYAGGGALLRAAPPVLTVDAATGAVVRVAFNGRSAGKLRGSAAFLEAYYGAWAALDALVNDAEFLLPVDLAPGDALVFDNARVLHGREAYVGPRFLEGAYIDMDAARSRVAAAAAAGAPAPPDARRAAAGRVVAAVASQAAFKYGEGVDMLAHALQVADVAASRGEAGDAVLACLLHDVGNAPQARDLWAETRPPARLLVSDADGSIGYEHHSAMGAAFARAAGLPEAVASAVGLHVEAKRALVASDPGYFAKLSEASVQTLKRQGGPMNASELAAFEAAPGADVALRLRVYDDLGKDPGRDVPGLGAYEDGIYEAILRATGGGDRCHAGPRPTGAA